MFQLPIVPHYLLSIAFGLFLSLYLHEGSHWFTGWLGNSDPKVEWRCGVPIGVDHGNLETIDPVIIRLSGLSIFLWIPPGVLALVYLLLNFSPGAVFIAAIPTGILISATESDAIALRNPEKFREMWLNNEFPRNPLFFSNRWLSD